MFHVHSIHLSFGVNERKLAKRLDVAVKMESSTKPNSFLLQISSYENNAGTRFVNPSSLLQPLCELISLGNIYEFRRQILRLPITHLNNLACPPRLLDVNDIVLSTAIV